MTDKTSDLREAAVDEILRESNLYAILGLRGSKTSSSYSSNDIRKAYEARSRLCHSDIAAFQKLKLAYDVLVVPSTRSSYDLTGQPKNLYIHQNQHSPKSTPTTRQEHDQKQSQNKQQNHSQSQSDGKHQNRNRPYPFKKYNNSNNSGQRHYHYNGNRKNNTKNKAEEASTDNCPINSKSLLQNQKVNGDDFKKNNQSIPGPAPSYKGHGKNRKWNQNCNQQENLHSKNVEINFRQNPSSIKPKDINKKNHTQSSNQKQFRREDQNENNDKNKNNPLSNYHIKNHDRKQKLNHNDRKNKRQNTTRPAPFNIYPRFHGNQNHSCVQRQNLNQNIEENINQNKSRPTQTDNYANNINNQKHNQHQNSSANNGRSGVKQEPFNKNDSSNHNQNQSNHQSSKQCQTGPNPYTTAQKIALVDQILKEDDLYTIIGLKRINSTSYGPNDIKKAYIARSRLCHPDKLPNYPKSTEAFKKLQFAHETLSDPSSKRKYDISGFAKNSTLFQRESEQSARPSSQGEKQNKKPHHDNHKSNQNQETSGSTPFNNYKTNSQYQRQDHFQYQSHQESHGGSSSQHQFKQHKNFGCVLLSHICVCFFNKNGKSKNQSNQGQKQNYYQRTNNENHQKPCGSTSFNNCYTNSGNQYNYHQQSNGSSSSHPQSQPGSTAHIPKANQYHQKGRNTSYPQDKFRSTSYHPENNCFKQFSYRTTRTSQGMRIAKGLFQILYPFLKKLFKPLLKSFLWPFY
ncbi:expressed protein [Phakopsora pachyrhizi]|uniref:Expressed protein n=1 Tax=Phakopsora pachyrhizi TaxID=170000 RepID=A0AAV0B145_PHAPC|nr:expressed protein [Phakopsora pachyrhizi]